jgi:hypothetical protein
MTFIPNELIFEVIDHLDDPADLVRMSRACRQFRWVGGDRLISERVGSSGWSVVGVWPRRFTLEFYDVHLRRLGLAVETWTIDEACFLARRAERMDLIREWHDFFHELEPPAVLGNWELRPLTQAIEKYLQLKCFI